MPALDLEYEYLYVNGELKEEMNIQTRYFNEGKSKMRYVRTLVFPLEKAGSFRSKVSNLKVYDLNGAE